MTAIKRELWERFVGDCAEDSVTAPAHTILMISDNSDDCEAFRRALMKADENYLYREAGDSVTGIASIEADRPDCVLLDYSVAGLSGLDVLRRIRETNAFLPVIMLTGYAGETIAMKAMKKGAQSYLVKTDPNSDVLHRTIIAAIEHAFLEREISDQRRELHAQKLALAETGLLNKAILHSAGVMIIATGRDGTILTFNPAAERALGYAAKEVVGVHTPTLWFDEAEIVTHASELAVGGAETCGFDTLTCIPQLMGQETREWTFIRKNGSRFPVNCSVTPMRDDDDQAAGFLCIAEDITLRQEQERALKVSEETFRGAVECAPNGMALIDPRGRLLRVNPALCMMLGYDAEELINMPLKSIPHPEDVDFDEESISKLSRGEIDFYRAEMRLLHKSGRVIHAQLSMSLSRHHDGSAKYYVAQALDITQRIEMDRVRSEFISVVSHELRTPLTSIRGSLGLLGTGQIGKHLPETARKLLAIAYKNCERLILLVNDILDIDKIASGAMRLDLRPETVGSLLEEAAASIRGYVEEFGVHLQLDPSASDLMLKVDRERFIQVLNNLLSNAVKFSPKDGVVELRAEAREDSVRILVRDHGPGIPREFQDRLFNKFFQADASATRKQGGTGLGLHISRQIIERMGGQIGFDTKVGGGTTMWVQLPLLTAHPALRSSEEAIRPELGRRVLVCEDDDRVAWFIQKLLTKEGFAADVVHSIPEARRLLKAVDYAAMTLDLAFPEGNGIDFAREINADPQMAQVPIIIVSGTERAASVDLGEKCGIVDWIVKPINRQHLVASVEKAAA